MDKKSQGSTRERILKHAEILFSEKGFRAVTVREITQSAGSNLAAVNYHFKNKKNLYLEVFRTRWIPRTQRVHNFFKRTLAAQEKPTPETVIRSLARAYLQGPLSDKERRHHFMLMSREMATPTAAFELVTSQLLRPFSKEIELILGSVLPDDYTQERLRLSTICIFAMILHFDRARVLVTQVTGKEYDTAFKVRVIEHIVTFSLQGLGITET